MVSHTFRPGRWLLLLAAAGLLAALFAQSFVTVGLKAPVAGAQAVNLHGIGFAKGCDGPVNPGDQYTCGFLIANTTQLDTAGDTMEVTSLVDVVHGAAGDVTSPDLLPTRTIAAYFGGAQCYADDAQTILVPVGGTGSTVCVLPSNSSVALARAPVGYVITEADALAGTVDDDATIVYEDQCTSAATDCPIGPNETQAGASAEVNPPTPTPTATSTNTPTSTPTNTPTATATATNTPVPPTATSTATATNTPVPPTNTPTPTNTATPVPPTNTPTSTATPVPPAQGCTPGYWKQDHHFDSWQGYTQNQTIGSVFDVPGTTFDSVTLVAALDGGGGPGIDGATKILLRAAVAALLNASSSGVDYQYTTAQITSQVNAALATGNRDTILKLAGELDAANNAGSCPLN